MCADAIAGRCTHPGHRSTWRDDVSIVIPSAAAPVEELIGVYDADGGVLGELRYVLGRNHCALCTLTHGAVRRRPGWDALVGHLSVPVRLLHRNEQDDALRPTLRDQLPCIVARGAGAQRILLGPTDLEACGADLDELERRIRRALAS